MTLRNSWQLFYRLVGHCCCAVCGLEYKSGGI